MIVWLQVALVAVALLAVHRPGGDYLARAFTGGSYLRVERFVYRVCRVDPDADQPAAHYVTSLLAFSVVSVHLLLRVQHLPPAAGRPKMPPDQAFNTAVSFHTNTSWQSYAGESALGHLAQAAGIGVAAFVSAAVGLAVALALTRGFARDATDRLGNFYVDLVRGCVRVLLPLSVGGAIALAALGVVQNLAGEQTVSTLGGGVQHLPGGPVASFEPIKLISGDGGGFFGANSAHPFENPNGASNLLQILLMLVIPVCVPRMFGRMVGDLRQGWAVFAVMALLWLSAVGLATAAEVSAPGSAPGAAGAALEGKEVRFGPASSALFAVAGTSTSDGAVNASHDAFTAAGGGVLLTSMLLGEVSPGGVGSGLYGLVVLAMLAVFLAGLMVGRSPEFLGKRVGTREIRLVALYVIVAPLTILVGTVLALALPGPRSALLHGTGPHGLTEMLYAFTSATVTNGSAFGGLSANTTFFNTILGLAMLVGRFVPLVLVLRLSASLAEQRRIPHTTGTLPTHTPLFVVVLTAVVLVESGLAYFPVLALGPLAEALS